MTDAEIIRWQTEPDGVVVLTMDDPAQSANTLSERFVTALGDTVARLKQEREHIAGVVLTSAKKTFFAGGDLHELLGLQAVDASRFTTHLNGIKAQLRALETLGRPVVAAINGAALGGGLELALACHHSIAAEWCAWCGASGSRLGWRRCCCPGSGSARPRPSSWGWSTSLSRASTSSCCTRSSGSPRPPSRASPGTSPGSRYPAAPPPAGRWPPSCPILPPTCAARTQERRLPRPGPSWPRPWRVRRWTWRRRR